MTTTPCEVWFYHLERSSLDQVLPDLLDRDLKEGVAGGRPGAGAERLDHLDGWLWSFRDESFLPHGWPASRSPSTSQCC